LDACTEAFNQIDFDNGAKFIQQAGPANSKIKEGIKMLSGTSSQACKDVEKKLHGYLVEISNGIRKHMDV